MYVVIIAAIQNVMEFSCVVGLEPPAAVVASELRLEPPAAVVAGVVLSSGSAYKILRKWSGDSVLKVETYLESKELHCIKFHQHSFHLLYNRPMHRKLCYYSTSPWRFLKSVLLSNYLSLVTRNSIQESSWCSRRWLSNTSVCILLGYIRTWRCPRCQPRGTLG